MKFVPRSSAYRKAELETQVARGDFLRSVDKAKARLSPVRLKDDAVRQLHRTADHMRRDAAEAARKHPLIVGGIAATVVGWIFRKPLLALSRTASVSIRKAWDARRNQETSDE